MPLNYQFPNYYTNNQTQQQNGFVTVRTENEARDYPVAPGTSITFMSENSPYVFTKTMGLNQLDRPVFKKYRLVEEICSQNQAETENMKNKSSEDLEAKFEQIWSELEQIKKDMKNIRSFRQKRPEKKGVIENE